MRMRDAGFLILIFVFLFMATSIYAEEEYEKWDKDNIPEGMEIRKVGDLRVLVPEDSKMRKVGDLLVVESPSEYYRRTMLEVKKDIEALEKSQGELKKELSELKKTVDEIERKNLVSSKKY